MGLFMVYAYGFFVEMLLAVGIGMLLFHAIRGTIKWVRNHL